MFGYCSLCLESNGYFEEVAVQVELEFAALEFGEAFGDAEAKAAAFGVSGDVAADEAFGELFGCEVKGLGGDVLQGENHLAVGISDFGVNSCVFHGVFCYVAENIFQHTPQALAVGTDHGRLIWEMNHHGQVVFFEALFEFPDYLVEHFYEIKVCHV